MDDLTLKAPQRGQKTARKVGVALTTQRAPNNLSSVAHAGSLSQVG
jgi:hypothetical protein